LENEGTVPKNESLRILTQKIPKLPTIPAVADKIMRLISSNTVFVSSITETIEKDPAISAKVIGFSNSAFYSRGESVTNIQDAVMKIGVDSVKSIALGISLLTLFKVKQNSEAGDYENIIRHSMAVSVIAKDIINVLKWPMHDDVFTSGLLHDIGLLVMNAFFPDIYGQIIARGKRGMPFADAEMEVCGFTHGDIGAWIADKWRLPDSLNEVIRYHHTPFHDGLKPSIGAVVHLADVIAARNDFSPTSIRGYGGPLDSNVLSILGMTEHKLLRVESRVEEIVDSVMRMWL